LRCKWVVLSAITFDLASSSPRDHSKSSNMSEGIAEATTMANASAARVELLTQVALEANASMSNTTSRLLGATSDCAHRLNSYSRHNSACIFRRGGKALLVYVPYGSSAGWDLPGGEKKGTTEAACETAERETCEESGYQVKAVSKITSVVFLCEYVASNVCTKRVDEGFLQKRWVSAHEVNSLKYRGGTWGNKREMLHQQLR